MDMKAERFIAAPQARVWAALNDPAILKACLPGCESVERLSDTEMKATAQVRLGPVSAKFAGRVTLSEIDPPHGCTIRGEGQGGAAGFAKGEAQIRLAPKDGGTTLSYTVKAQVGGKLAQIGARLIDAGAKTMADQFFAAFARQLEQPAGPDAPPPSLWTRIVAFVQGLFAPRG